MKKKFIYLLISSFPLLLSCNYSFSQDAPVAEKNELYKNAFYGNFGALDPLFHNTLTAYYERILKHNVQNHKTSLFIRIGLGNVGVGWIGYQKFKLAQLGLLFGEKKHHLEIGAGPGYFDNRDLFPKTNLPAFEFQPTGIAAYRYQKPKGHFIFRAGIAYPETIFIGLGLSF